MLSYSKGADKGIKNDQLLFKKCLPDLVEMMKNIFIDFPGITKK